MVVTWVWTRVEITSAVERRYREGRFSRQSRRDLLSRLETLAAQWDEITDAVTVRKYAVRLLARHRLRAADAAQLGAAIVYCEDGSEQRLRFDRCLIATGASPAIPPVPGLDATPHWTSTEALEAEALPKRMVVLGAGYVACELAQAFARLGTQVTVLARSTILSHEDPLIGQTILERFRAEGIEVREHCEADRIDWHDDMFRVSVADETLSADRLLVATGRAPNTATLDLAKAGIETGPRGAVVVDARMRTNIESVYAVGDCTDMPEFVYVAAAAGTRAAVNMTGGDTGVRSCNVH